MDGFQQFILCSLQNALHCLKLESYCLAVPVEVAALRIETTFAGRFVALNDSPTEQLPLGTPADSVRDSCSNRDTTINLST